MRAKLFPILGLFVLSVFVIPAVGCADKEPAGPEPGSIQQFLDENPEIAEREDEVEPDGDVGDGSE